MGLSKYQSNANVTFHRKFRKQCFSLNYSTFLDSSCFKIVQTCFGLSLHYHWIHVKWVLAAAVKILAAIIGTVVHHNTLFGRSFK